MMVAERDTHLATPAAAQAMHEQGQWQGPPQWQAGGVVNHQPQRLPQMHFGAADHHHPQSGNYGFDQRQMNRIPRAHYPNGHRQQRG